MSEILKAPQEYMRRLNHLRQSNPYANRWTLRLEKKNKSAY